MCTRIDILNDSYKVLYNELKKLSKEQLISMKEQLIQNDIDRINMDDAFMSSKISNNKLSIIDILLEAPKKYIDYKGYKTQIGNYIVSIETDDYSVMHIQNKELKINVVVDVITGKCKGKGIRKYEEDIFEVAYQVEKTLKHHKYE